MTKEVKRYFKIFECDRNLLNILYIPYQQAFIATPQDKYYNLLMNNVVKDNNLKGAPLSNDNLGQEDGKVMKETEA